MEKIDKKFNMGQLFATVITLEGLGSNVPEMFEELWYDVI